MRATVALLQSFFRSNVRNRQGLFWTLFFPVVLMIVFGFLGNGGVSRVSLAVVGAGTKNQVLVSALEKAPLFKVTTMSQAQALSAVQGGKQDVALILPAAATGGTASIQLKYNNANLLTAQQSVGAVEAFISQVNLQLSGRPPAFSVAASPMAHSKNASYLDFLLPGILALMAMQNSLFGIGSGLTRWKEKGILRRFMATPVSPIQLLGATVLNYLIFGIITSAIVVGIGVTFLHASVTLPILPVFVTLVVGMAAFLAMGFIIAGVSKTQDATIPIINLVSFPMMFLSGVFFPVSNLPKVLQAIVGFFPLTYLANGIRGLMSGQITGFSGPLLGDLVGLLAWLVACGAVAAVLWRWE